MLQVWSGLVSMLATCFSLELSPVWSASPQSRGHRRWDAHTQTHACMHASKHTKTANTQGLQDWHSFSLIFSLLLLMFLLQVWSCSSCFSLFHLLCIQKWARDSVFLVSSVTDEDFGQKNPPWSWSVVSHFLTLSILRPNSVLTCRHLSPSIINFPLLCLQSKMSSWVPFQRHSQQVQTHTHCEGLQVSDIVWYTNRCS